MTDSAEIEYEEQELPTLFGTYLVEITEDGNLYVEWSSGDALTTKMFYEGYDEFLSCD